MRRVLLAGLAFGLGVPASATVTVYTDPVAFKAAAGGQVTRFNFPFRDEDREYIPIGPEYQFRDILFESGLLASFNDEHFVYGTESVSGPRYLDTYSSLHVTTPRHVLGLYLGTYYDCCDLQITYQLGSKSGSVQMPTYGTATFLGVIDTSGPVDWTLRSTGLDLAVASILTPVPEPATWTMMLGGFGMLGWAVGRKKFRLAQGTTAAATS
ncbi:hypothetical protein SCH01S_39_01740 [Sphingomonas changbaiensis NBRC 104936]|uniref:Ice-binding protein C-terminal domain-containing protein n=1 Tax=Sphingomonas changbaiensis NBRC 104936 TaxID=1219043 RepID=A0A0E9MQT5_9SPHN|nr:PEPxxWA-CTERM sorting domain-containing protein [Sphingomonas changbaiensis]GAO39889.1 hypothetical protein SCH01S_39_01740 [Sphingomonas changbaiensis NBRC 104936]